MFPLLAYKYNDEDPGQSADVVNTDILRHAGEAYVETRYSLQAEIENELKADTKNIPSSALGCVETNVSVEREDFAFWGFDRQLKALTESQRKIVEYESTNSPLRVEGAAGTGKTVALIMRAYRLLKFIMTSKKLFTLFSSLIVSLPLSEISNFFTLSG